MTTLTGHSVSETKLIRLTVDLEMLDQDRNKETPVTAKVYNFEEERRKRALTKDPNVQRCYNSLKDAPASSHVPDEILLKWAYMLGTGDNMTMPQIVTQIEDEMDKIGFKY